MKTVKAIAPYKINKNTGNVILTDHRTIQNYLVSC
jgi:hypothetical protein